jgi:murein DD-endopeptidase MepM/ murein hydrolase activator NlpD
MALAKQREKKLLSIPSIKPVREDKLKRNMHSLSGFGYRIHPVHGVKKFHKGIDFTAPRGTAIQATGNGKVIRVQKRRYGYGNNIIIDHGFGYTTLYAHLSEIDIQVGDEVVKGQKIGTIGSTGTSTAPHLHYEVRINDRVVNPIDYCMDGLTLEEYQELVRKASIENQSFDY